MKTKEEILIDAYEKEWAEVFGKKPFPEINLNAYGAELEAMEAYAAQQVEQATKSKDEEITALQSRVKELEEDIFGVIRFIAHKNGYLSPWKGELAKMVLEDKTTRNYWEVVYDSYKATKKFNP